MKIRLSLKGILNLNLRRKFKILKRMKVVWRRFFCGKKMQKRKKRNYKINEFSLGF